MIGKKKMPLGWAPSINIAIKLNDPRMNILRGVRSNSELPFLNVIAKAIAIHTSKFNSCSGRFKTIENGNTPREKKLVTTKRHTRNPDPERVFNILAFK